MEVSELVEAMKLLRGNKKADDSHWKVAKPYFIRTVTHHYTGKLTKVTAKEIVLTDCAWIADDGRFATALEKGEFNEVEPFPEGDVIVGRGAILDAHVIRFGLPREQK